MRPALILGVDKRYVREADESEDVAQVRHLKIEGFCGGALLISASASGNDDDLFHFQKTAGTIGPVTEGLPDPHNLVNPSLQRDEMEKLYIGAPMTIVSAARSSSIN